MAVSIVSGYPISVDRADGGSTPFTLTLTASGGTPLAAGQPIVLLLASDGIDATSQTFSTPTSSNITWNLVARSNTNSSGIIGGTAEVWKGVPGSSLTSDEAVSIATTPFTTMSATAVAVAFTGASTTTPSNTASSTLSATPQVTLAGTASGSLVYGVVLDWTQGSTTVQGSDTSDHAYSPAGLITSVTLHETNASAGGDIRLRSSTRPAPWTGRW